jgi:hypothetical protein
MMRHANLLDFLGVLADMDLTMRGQDELAQARRLIDESLTLDQIAALLFRQSVSTYAFTAAQAPGRALAVGGFIPERSGVLRTWMLATDEAWENYGMTLTTECAGILKEAIKKAHRIEVVCLNSRERTHRWYNRIGLQKEATLARYCTDGSDAALFVLTRGTL